EAIRVGREGSLPVQVSHIKAAGRPNWGKVADALALIDEARAVGLDVMGDVYPYTASSTSLRTALPDWALEGGAAGRPKRRRARRGLRAAAPRRRRLVDDSVPARRGRPQARARASGRHDRLRRLGARAL